MGEKSVLHSSDTFGGDDIKVVDGKNKASEWKQQRNEERESESQH